MNLIMWDGGDRVKYRELRWTVGILVDKRKYSYITHGPSKESALDKMAKYLGLESPYTDDRNKDHYEKLVRRYCKHGPHVLNVFDRRFINDYQRQYKAHEVNMRW